MDPDPLRQFDLWFGEALALSLPQPNQMALATATPDGDPSVRMVLLKGFDASGFVFFTNYESRKGRELAANPRAALCFYWYELHRQVRISGTVSRVGSEESAAYFATRPLMAKAGAVASRQSQVLEDRSLLDRQVEELESRHNGEIPLPPHWGGYRLSATAYEFWQGRENRLHDRLLYEPAGEGWRIVRLYP